MGGNFREMLDTVVRINFRGSNFRGTRVRAIRVHAIGADDVIWKLVYTRGRGLMAALRFTVQCECDATSSVKDMWEASVGE